MNIGSYFQLKRKAEKLLTNKKVYKSLNVTYKHVPGGGGRIRNLWMLYLSDFQILIIFLQINL